MNNPNFDQQYYDRLMKEFGYSPLEFESISYSLKNLTKEDLQKQWLCHMNGKNFADASNIGKRVIATTGFGLSGVPHMGTLSQILRSLRLQKAGIPVQIVLGDLDAHNGKNTSLERTRELSESYRKFILNLGFKDDPPSRLRSQFDSLTTLRASYLIGHYMDDEMFNQAEEDLHEFYVKEGKVDSLMTYRRKLSLNLMIADFFELILDDGFEAVMVILGIDEHKYVRFGRQIFEKMSTENPGMFMGKSYSAMYSGIIRGFHGYPKMSKSFLDSGITVDMSSNDIARLIESGEAITEFPETNVVYQMIAAVSLYDNNRINEAYIECGKQSVRWKKIKCEYAIHLSQICQRWNDI
jgi:tryptophanyl-tRNA synthetase